ncbi:MAG: GNAT family N-acetyltransferase [Gemmatimonadota bacterium]
MRSKAVWGYDADFLADCRGELTVSPESIAAGRVWVREAGGRAVGFYTLSDPVSGGGAGPEGPRAELLHLFIEPEAIGHGHGRALLAHAAERARALGCRWMRVESDPDAEGFYVRHGGRRVGWAASPVRPGRRLPELLIPL